MKKPAKLSQLVHGYRGKPVQPRPSQPCMLHLQPSCIPNQFSVYMDSRGESNEAEKDRKPSGLNTK